MCYINSGKYIFVKGGEVKSSVIMVDASGLG